MLWTTLSCLAGSIAPFGPTSWDLSVVSVLKTARTPCCSSFKLVGDFGTVVWFSGLGKFLQERKRIAVRNQNRWQMCFLLGDDKGFCYETLGALVKALNNIAFYWLRVVWIICIDRCAWASCICWWWSGRRILLKLRCLGRRVYCHFLSPWWRGSKAAGCLDTIRSHARFRIFYPEYQRIFLARGRGKYFASRGSRRPPARAAKPREKQLEQSGFLLRSLRSL